MTLRTERPEYGAQWIVYPVYRVGKNLRAQDRRNPSTNFNNEPTRSFHSISFSILAWSAKADSKKVGKNAPPFSYAVYDQANRTHFPTIPLIFTARRLNPRHRFLSKS